MMDMLHLQYQMMKSQFLQNSDSGWAVLENRLDIAHDLITSGKLYMHLCVSVDQGLVADLYPAPSDFHAVSRVRW